MPEERIVCPQCDTGMSRRQFVKTVGRAAVAASAVSPLLLGPRQSLATTFGGFAETALTQFYASLTGDQRKVICFPFEHELRRRIAAHWAITEPTIGEFFNTAQQGLISEIFQSVCSGDGYERFQRQMQDDAGGIGGYHVAVFGQPGSGKFQWEMSGAHLTIRADGDRADNTAFGGPIVYGHSAGNSQPGLPGNLFSHHTKKANEVFAALDGKQREKALLEEAPREHEVTLQGTSGTFPGIAVGELSDDQKGLVKEVIKALLAPYHESHVEETLGVLDAGGFDRLHMSFYKSHDLGEDGEWDIWRLEGPTFVWHFRGAPHVHAYVNIASA